MLFHGSLGNIGAALDYYKILSEKTHSDLLVVSYRGFSDSDGTPSEEGLKTDAKAILEFAVQYQQK